MPELKTYEKPSFIPEKLWDLLPALPFEFYTGPAGLVPIPRVLAKQWKTQEAPFPGFGTVPSPAPGPTYPITPPASTTEAYIKVDFLDISPTTVRVGEMATLRFRAVNLGESAGSREIFGQTITLGPGVYDIFTIPFYPTEVKTYSFKIDGNAVTLQALSPTAPAPAPQVPAPLPPPPTTTPAPAPAPTPPPSAPAPIPVAPSASTYSFSITAPQAGASPSSGNYPAGTQLTLYPGNISAGYVFDHWVINGLNYTQQNPTITLNQNTYAEAFNRLASSVYQPSVITIPSGTSLQQILDLIAKSAPNQRFILATPVIPPPETIPLVDPITRITYGFQYPPKGWQFVAPSLWPYNFDTRDYSYGTE